MLAIVTLMIGLIPGILKGIPGIPAKLQQIIADITGSVSAVLGSGAVTQPALNTILAAWLGVVNALKNDPSLPPGSLSAVAELEKLLQSVLLQDSQLSLSVDWTKMHPITPVP